MTQFGKFFRKPSLLPVIRGLSSCEECQQSSGKRTDVVRWEDTKPYESIPGPKPLPIPNFGNYWRFTAIGPYGNLEPEQMMMKLKEEFGDIIRITVIGQEDMVFLCDKHSVEKMFRHELKTPIRHTVEWFKYYQEKHRPGVFSTSLGIGMFFTYDCVIRKCEEIEKGSNSDGNEPRSLLEAMIRSKNMEFAVVAGTDLVSAGVDTVSKPHCQHSIRFFNDIVVFRYRVLSHLTTHPEKQQKLFEELKIVLPDKNTPSTDVAHGDMKYLKAALKESFRLRPVSPGNSRTTATNLVLGGYKIPKGTKLLSLGSIISVDDRYFKQPEKFIPERWLKTEEKSELSVTNSSAFANTPFGFGPRMCIGRRFADLQMQTLLATIIRNFEATYHYGDMEWRLALFLKPIKPLKLRIIDRPS